MDLMRPLSTEEDALLDGVGGGSSEGAAACEAPFLAKHPIAMARSAPRGMDRCAGR